MIVTVNLITFLIVKRLWTIMNDVNVCRNLQSDDEDGSSKIMILAQVDYMMN